MPFYVLIYLALQTGVRLFAPADWRPELLFGMLGGIILVLAAYFLAPRVYRALTISHFVVYYSVPLLVGRGIDDWALAVVYTVGVVIVVEIIGLSSLRQRQLIAQHAETEQRARASESLLRGILSSSPNQIVLKDRDKRFQYVNPAFLAATGWQEEHILGKRDRELLPPALAQRYEMLDEYVIREKRAHPDALDWVEDGDGKFTWYKLTKTPIFDAEGDVEQVLSISSDVTELKNAQEALNRNVQSLQTLAEVSSLLLAVQGFDAGLEMAFPAIGETLEATQLCLFVNGNNFAIDALDGAFPDPCHTPDSTMETGSLPAVLRHHWAADPSLLNATHEKTLLCGYQYILQTRCRDLLAGKIVALNENDPDTHWLAYRESSGIRQAYIAPIFVADRFWGALICVFQREETVAVYLDSFFTALATNIGIAIDRHEVQRTNLRERNLLRTIVDNAPDFVYIKDTYCRYIIANRAFVEVMGFEAETDIIGKTDYDIHPRHVAEQIGEMDGPILRGEQDAYTVQEQVVLPLTHEQRWLLTTKAPFHNAEGEIVGLITISRDVTEMKEVEHRLREAKEAAEAATRAKSQFLANMSHEIRTPMNGVIGMTSLLLSSPLQPDQREFVDTIRTSSDDLLMILNDILDYSKIESGKLELENEAFDPLAAVEDVVDLYSARRYGGPLTLSIVVAGDRPARLRGDVTRFRQVVGNLVANAVKFTQEGEVFVHLSATVDRQGECVLHVSVRDTGIGIPQSRVDRLFKSFTQVDSSTTRRFGGTGLGLAISKRLVEMMHGAIHVRSREGEGSEFFFTVRLPVVVETLTSDKLNLNGALPQSGLQPALAAHPNAKTYAGIRFLVADANSYSRTAIGRQLEEWGGEVAAVGASDEMAAILRRQSIGVLICDMDWYANALAALTQKQAEQGVVSAQDAPFILRLAKWGVGTAGTYKPHANASAHESRNGDLLLFRPVKPTALANALARLTQRGAEPVAAQAVNAPMQEAESPPQLATEIPVRILLVEDNLVNQRVALRMLDRLGYQADLTANGIEALAALRAAHYDVVFMDIHMPEMDGHTATRHILAEFPPAHRPYIIAMTADAMPGYREECLAAGMDDYIAKPVRLEDLTDALRRSWARKQAGKF